VLKISNSCDEREETRTNTKHNKWFAKVMDIKYVKWTSPLVTCLHSIPLVFHSQSVVTRSQVPIQFFKSTHQEFNFKWKM